MSVYKPVSSPYYEYDFRTGGHRFSGSNKETNKRAAQAVERQLKEQAAEDLKRLSATGRAPPTFDEAAGQYWKEVGQYCQQEISPCHHSSPHRPFRQDAARSDRPCRSGSVDSGAEARASLGQDEAQACGSAAREQHHCEQPRVEAAEVDLQAGQGFLEMPSAGRTSLAETQASGTRGGYQGARRQ